MVWLRRGNNWIVLLVSTLACSKRGENNLSLNEDRGAD